MSGLELVDLGASTLDKSSGAVIAEAKGAPINADEAPSYNSAPMMPCLGVACRPAAADARGSAQGIAAQVGGLDGVIIGGHDPRAAKIYGEIKDGETALFATGDGYDCRVLCKDQMLSVMVGDDYVFLIDRKKGQVAINSPGGDFRIAEKSGISLISGGALGQFAKGVISLVGKIVLGGRKPVGTVAQAEKVDAHIALIWSVLTGFVPVPADGGAALKTAATAAQAARAGIGLTKAPGVFIGG